jgi:hypothetical protein
MRGLQLLRAGAYRRRCCRRSLLALPPQLRRVRPPRLGQLRIQHLKFTGLTQNLGQL